MKIGDMLINKWTGYIGIIVHTENNIEFDVYWAQTDQLHKCVHYSYLLEHERETKKLMPR